MISAAKKVKKFRIPPGNNLEQLAENLAGERPLIKGGGFRGEKNERSTCV